MIRYVLKSEFPPNRDALEIYLLRYQTVTTRRKPRSEYATFDPDKGIVWHEYEPMMAGQLEPFVSLDGMTMTMKREQFTDDDLLRRLEQLARQYWQVKE